MWIEGNYRRNLMDMHISDEDPVFLSRLNVTEYVDALKDAGIQAAMVKGKPHTGLCYYPTKVGEMHRNLHSYDFFGDMIQKCHENGIAVVAYFTQIFDNWAYEHHPEWRVITAEGKNFMEYRGKPNFKTGRYGIVCPNNEGYRAYVKESLQEMNRMYDFEGMFLDMAFWPDICFCPSCRARYRKETGKELPRRMDWKDPDWLAYTYKRDEWMAEFAKASTTAVKEIKPQVTIEHQFSRITMPWGDAASELLMDAVDCASGDYYGGFLQQTFINKYYRSVSPKLPFVYHTSRCDPELVYHTTTKTKDELLLHVITALVHNGAFLLVDAINPDGSIVPEIYHGLMKEIYEETSVYESCAGGELLHDASIWFASHAKFDPAETGLDVTERSMEPGIYMEAPVAAASVLRGANIPFHVIGTRNIAKDAGQVLILSHVAHIRDEEMAEIERWIAQGKNVFISGPVGHLRLEELLGLHVTGETAHDFTYMSPTKEGESLFEGFSHSVPLTVPRRQVTAELTENSDAIVLATLTLPYTMTNTEHFAAIHSNPPGVYTDMPAAVMRRAGNSILIWTAAPIELSRPYLSRQVFKRMVQYLAGDPSLVSDAPKYVEILHWKKEGKEYLAAINEQEEPPVVPVEEITVTVRTTAGSAVLLPDKIPLKTEKTTDGQLKLYIKKLNVFQIIQLQD